MLFLNFNPSFADRPFMAIMILMLNKQEILPPNDFIEADVVQRVSFLIRVVNNPTQM